MIRSAIILLVALLFIGRGAQAQQIEKYVIGSAGNTLSNEEVSIEWTIGEAFISSYQSPAIELNEGFHNGESFFAEALNLPDLAIESFELQQDELFPGQSSIWSEMHYAIVDSSMSTLDQFFYSYYWLSRDTAIDDGDRLLYQRIFRSEGISKVDSNFTFIMMPDSIDYGEWNIIIEIDAQKAIEESNEQNNTLLYPITIVDPNELLPDLIVDHVEPIAIDIYPGTNYQLLNYFVKNLGAEAIVSVSSGLSLSTNDIYGDEDDIAIGSDYFSATIKTDSSDQLSLFYSIPDTISVGIYNAFLCVNPSGSVDELNYDNNCYAFEMVISDPFEAADLVVDYIDSHPYYFQNDFQYVDITVLNQGRSDAELFIGELYISPDTIISSDDTRVGLIIIDSIKVDQRIIDESYMRIRESEIDPGDYYLISTIDIYDQVYEYDEANNVSHTPLTIYSLAEAPDLIIDNMQVMSDININDSITVSTQISNVGVGTARSSRVTFFLSPNDSLTTNNTYLGFVDVDEIASSDSANVEFNFHLADSLISNVDSTYFLFAYADGFRYLGEVNEENNERSMELNLSTKSNMTTPTTKTVLSIDGYSIYPVPAGEVIYVKSDLDRHYTYEIIDVSGRIYQKGIDEAKIVISHLPAGQYWLRLTAKAGIIESLPFIKE